MRVRDEKSKLYQFMIEDYDFLELCNYYGYYSKEKSKIKEFLDYMYYDNTITRLDNYNIGVSWVRLETKNDIAIIDLDDLWDDLTSWLHEESEDEIGYGL